MDNIPSPFAVQSMGDVFSSLMAAIGAAEKVLELIQRQPAIVPVANLRPSYFAGNLAIDDVSFAYPARPNALVLRGLSFSVRPGEVSAFLQFCQSCPAVLMPCCRTKSMVPPSAGSCSGRAKRRWQKLHCEAH